MLKKYHLLFALLCFVTQVCLAWDGSGTSAAPYLIKNSADWKLLADNVRSGNSFSGQYFEMAADIDAQGISIGDSDKPFSGSFCGRMYTLTYNAGTIGSYKEGLFAPFVLLNGATIKDLKVKGDIYSRSKYAAGLACFVDGARTTTVSGCHVSIELSGSYDVHAEANFGGFVALVKSTVNNTLVFKNCSFQGYLGDFTVGSACFVGFTRIPIIIEHCMVDPRVVFQGIDNTATFVRTAPDVSVSLKECYYTQAYGTEQGEGVFKSVKVPEGCKAEMVSAPDWRFNGVDYYGAGAKVQLTVPKGTAFDHWVTTGKPVGCYISNPWMAGGTHTITDIRTQPQLSIATTMPKARKEREMDGTKYRFLGAEDYRLYMSQEYCAQKGFEFDKDGWLIKMVGHTKVYVTAVTGWVPGDIPADGAQIHNDLTGNVNDHTLTACIAPQAFQGCTELKTLYFKDTDAALYDAATQFDFLIGDYAFAHCPNLTEIKMMQYTTKGTNHWEALKPDQVGSVGDNVFSSSPQANFSVDASVYQDYMGSTTWKEQRRHIVIYNHTFEKYDFQVNGALYNCLFTTAGDPIKNDAAGHEAIMQQIRFWNSDYQQFSASSLLSNSSSNIWYAQVLGADDSYLRKNGGLMRIYNDPGSQYNYKTIAIKSLGGSKEVKAVEFYQTNGLSDNSYSDLKLVIRNNAFAGCDNLKELRMFYYVEDGEDHWETLGPKDVIPGDNIFGEPSSDDVIDSKLTAEELRTRLVPEGFHILVSPDLFDDYINDPNWSHYLPYIQPVDFSPTEKNDFTMEGLTYGYMTSPGDMMQTSQTVSQDVSWWTAPRIAIEVLMWAAQIKSIYTSLKTAFSAASAAKGTLAAAQNTLTTATNTLETAQQAITDITSINTDLTTAMRAGVKGSFETQGSLMYVLDDLPVNDFLTSISQLAPKNYAKLVNWGFIKNNLWSATEELLEDMTAEELSSACFLIKEGLVKTAASKTAAIAAARNAVTAATTAVEEATAGLTAANAARLAAILKGLGRVGIQATATNTASMLAAKCWGGTGSYNGDVMLKGMRENILSNIHQVGLVGGGFVVTTPQKNLIYHTYIKKVSDDVTDAVIYAGTGKKQGRNNNARTMTMDKKAFNGNTKLKTVKFHETDVQSDEALPMLFTIPDSAFVGCTALTTLDLRVVTDGKGLQALGPESFILAGDSIFAGLDPAKFHIVIDPKRKQDFLDNESWKPLERYFVYEAANPKTQYQEYGGNYAYAYENGTTQKAEKVRGHKILHTLVTGADDSFLDGHQGALKLCNDIGVYDNYQLDAVTAGAFRGNQHLRVVNFTDLKGSGAFGDSYTGLQVVLMDSCFADCKNLVNLDLLYLVTDGNNHIDPIRPTQVYAGSGFLDGTTARIKMMPQQVAWFEADSVWNKYRDRFLPCIIKPGDEGVRNALKDMAYYDMAHTGYDPTTWDNYIDLARIGGAGFSWLDGRFQSQKDNILSFTEFCHFSSVGLDYVGSEWFRDCKNLSNILLPQTIKTIGASAFAGCHKLGEIELPASVTEIGDEAFNDCPILTTVRVRGTTPATLKGKNQFSRTDGLKIYVPATSVDDYKRAWADYKDYIASDAGYKVNKVVTVTKPDELAEKLGLYVEMSYSGLAYGDEPRYIHGPYAKYDSLTVSGPLGNVDLAVIRYLAGSDAYSAGGKATDGQLRYLNLYDADIKKTDDGCHYYNDEQAMVGARYSIKADNKLPLYVFKGCTALETVILPKSLTDMDGCIFAECSALKRVAITGNLKDYDNAMYLSGILDYPLEELVFVSDEPAVSEHSNPWGQPIAAVFTKKSQLNDYMNQPYLTRVTRYVTALFDDDAVMETLARKGQFFPTEYLSAERAENIFNGNQRIKTFDEFSRFSVTALDRTFAGADALRRISIPDSVKTIGAEAFSGCVKLDTIRITTDRVPTLAHNAFASLPKDFRILVPKSLCKTYREQWAAYADHINVDQQDYADSEWTVVTLDKPNTLAEKLGFNVSWDFRRMTLFSTKHNYISGVRGNYNKIRKLKVKGPVSGSDFAIMRYLAGFCPWANSRNMMGHLEAIDLYDADIKASDDLSAPDMFKVITHMGPSNVESDNELPSYAFLQAYNLKSLVLPRTCTKINTRALQQCEALETLVLGDSLVNFDWSALDDDVMLTRLYIMAQKKPAMTQDNWLVRQLYNNYNPTFDAFYVRPSLYEDYLADRAYTHDLQRTNLISKSVFDDDDSFCAFAAHAAAAKDDLATVMSVEGWFDHHPGAKNLSLLGYTAVDTLSKATLAPLTQLQKIVMPITLKGMEEGLFAGARHLRYADFLMCDSTDVVAGLRNGGFAKLGINTQQTLAYVPATYGDTNETNVVVADGSTLRTKTYRLTDSLDYCVPYPFKTETIENSRPMQASAVPYTVCVPYRMKVPAYSRAYELSERDGNTLVFTEVTDELEAMKPYLVKVVGNKRFRKTSTTLNTDIAQTIPASGGNTYGRQDETLGYTLRGTFDAISNKEAADLGAYILQNDGNWHPVTTANSQATILPFRAFLLPSTHNAGACIGMTMEDDDATDIDSIVTVDQDGTHRYYDLNGRQLQGKPAKGIYIYNGNKYINK